MEKVIAAYAYQNTRKKKYTQSQPDAVKRMQNNMFFVHIQKTTFKFERF